MDNTDNTDLLPRFTCRTMYALIWWIFVVSSVCFAVGGIHLGIELRTNERTANRDINIANDAWYDEKWEHENGPIRDSATNCTVLPYRVTKRTDVVYNSSRDGTSVSYSIQRLYTCNVPGDQIYTGGALHGLRDYEFNNSLARMRDERAVGSHFLMWNAHARHPDLPVELHGKMGYRGLHDDDDWHGGYLWDKPRAKLDEHADFAGGFVLIAAVVTLYVCCFLCILTCCCCHVSRKRSYTKWVDVCSCCAYDVWSPQFHHVGHLLVNAKSSGGYNALPLESPDVSIELALDMSTGEETNYKTENPFK